MEHLGKLEDNSVQIRNGITTKDVKAMLEILEKYEKPAEKLKKEGENFVNSLVDYINNKFKKTVITYNPEKEVFSVTDEKEKVLKILKRGWDSKEKIDGII